MSLKKTMAVDVAEKAYAKLRTECPAIFPVSWATLPQEWKVALAVAVSFGSEAACEAALARVEAQEGATCH